VVAVIGAGAIGLVLAARSTRTGREVCLFTRDADAAAAIMRDGIHVDEPETGAHWNARVRAIVGAPPAGSVPIFSCVRVPDVPALAAMLAPGAFVVNVQNGVEGDAVFAEHGMRVAGAVIRQGCTRIAPNRVRSMLPGRIAIGVHAGCTEADLVPIARTLDEAGYEVAISPHIADDRWLKLCVNLMSTPNALIRPDEHTTRAFTEAKARLLEEARDVLRAAGITARSCDPRDRTLDEEIDAQRAAFERGTAARRLPIYNSLWQALRRGASSESDLFHRRIIELGADHGVATPVNRRALAILERTLERELGPESCAAADFLVDT
jgi:2-dehydropantoate 2-reductase